MSISKKYITNFWGYAKENLKIKNIFIREFISELFGTAILCFFIVGAGMQFYLHNNRDNRQPYLSATVGGTLGIMIAVLVSGGASGAHLNPAITLGVAFIGGCSWIKIPVYWLGQIIGGYLGSFLPFLLYKDKLLHLPNINKTAGDNIYDAIPIPTFLVPLPNGTNFWIGFADQTIATAILLIAILAIVDPNNMKLPKSMMPLSFGLVVAALSLCYHDNASNVLNNARDLCPRLVALSIGYSYEAAFTNLDYNGDRQHWWLVGLIAPFVGSIIGCFLYIVLIAVQIDDPKEKEAEAELEKKKMEEASKIKSNENET